MKRIGFLFAVMLLMAATHSNASADTLVFSQGFDAPNTNGVFSTLNGGSGVVKRAPSGFNGITSSSGAGYGTVSQDANGAPFTKFDGYRSVWTGGFRSSVDVYLPLTWSGNQGFDLSTAVSGTDGNHRRDFIFHAAFDTSTGKLLIGADNTTNFAPRQDLETIDHLEVTQAGWYTLQSTFYDNGGVLAVDMQVLQGNVVLFTHTLSDASDVMGLIGGNRYGWFTNIDLPANPSGQLAIDNWNLSVTQTPEPASMILLGTGLVGVAGAARRRFKKPTKIEG